MPNSIDIVIPAYNAKTHIHPTLESVLSQVLPQDWKHRIWVVDDGSSDNTCHSVRERFGSHVNVFLHNSNCGRAATCNTGAGLGNGSYIAFVDSDCVFTSIGALASHVKVLENSADVSIGLIETEGDGFWAHYQRRVASERQARFKRGNLNAFTSQNFAIKRTIFEKIGGFDERYREYGFEDRDLCARAIKAGAKIGFNSEAVVIHADDLDIEMVCAKMEAAGRFTSALFKNSHPEIYSRMPYARFDARLYPVFTLITFRWLIPFLPSLIKLAAFTVESRVIPYGMKSALVKVVSGLSFYKGTRKAQINTN